MTGPARAGGGEVDARLVDALRRQLADRHALLRDGARHVGWKLGMGDRESVGGHMAVGHLTSATALPSGADCPVDEAAGPHADAEAFVELGRGIGPDEDTETLASAFGRVGAALEIVDLAPRPGEPASAVAGNVFHRAVTWSYSDVPPPLGTEMRLTVRGQVRAAGPWPDDLGERIRRAARLLAAVGERLRAGDLVITGAVAQAPVTRGDEVGVHIGIDGSPARLAII